MPARSCCGPGGIRMPGPSWAPPRRRSPTPPALCAAVALAAGRRPLVAGMVLSLIWIKPNLALVLPAVVVLLLPGIGRRVLAGFGLGSVIAFGLAFASLRAGLLEWPRGIVQVWRSVQG